jgi:hypothetical protein
MDIRRLRKLFHFNEEDLAANRRGRFSEKQLQKLNNEARSERKSAWGLAAILFLIAAAGLAVGIGLGSIAPTTLGRVAMYVCMGALWPLVWGGKAIQIILAANALRTPHLSFVRGSVKVIHHGDQEYTLQVEGVEFDVDGNPSDAFTDGDEYTIYYVEATQEIMSIDQS